MVPMAAEHKDMPVVESRLRSVPGGQISSYWTGQVALKGTKAISLKRYTKTQQ